MGIDKRDYMQDRRDPGLSGRWAITSVSTRLILLNVVVFVIWQFAQDHRFMRDHFLVSWSNVFEHGRVWTLITSEFSHHDVWHLAWNMLYLHWFGIELEQIYGRRNFLLLYLHGAVVASLAHVAWEHGWGSDVPALGASGAVMAIAVVTAIFYPHRKVSLWFFIPVPLWLLATIFLLGDVTGMVHRGSGVAHAAHLGGAAAGAFFYWFDLRLFASPGQVESDVAWPSAVGGFFRRLFSRRPPMRVLPPYDPETAKVDDLLRKITREGMASLSPDELAFLKAASNKKKH